MLIRDKPICSLTRTTATGRVSRIDVCSTRVTKDPGVWQIYESTLGPYSQPCIFPLVAGGECLKQALGPVSVSCFSHDSGWSTLLQHRLSCELAASHPSC